MDHGSRPDNREDIREFLATRRARLTPTGTDSEDRLRLLASWAATHTLA